MNSTAGIRVICFFAGLAGSALLGVTRAARADASPQNRAIAESLFQDGLRLFEGGDTKAACGKFAESNRLDPMLGTLLNLARCHEKEGKTASAWAEFSDAAAAARTRGEAERAHVAGERADALRARLAYLVVEIDDLPAGAGITLDGSVLSSAVVGTPVAVDPGEHVLAVRAAGYEPWSQRVTVPEGPTKKSIAVELVRAGDRLAGGEKPRARVSQEPADDDGGGAAMGWVVGGLGVAGLAVGAYFGFDALDKKEEKESHCRGDACDPRGVELHDQAGTSATISTFAFALGAVGVGAGAYVLLSSKSGPTEAAWRLGGGPAGVRLDATW